MLFNVLYERKNMLYHELVEYIFENKMLIVCCIDSHFTALKIISNDALIYYNPLSSDLKEVSGKEDARKFVVVHLLKCKYAD